MEMVACMKRERVCVCKRESVCVCVCVREREREREIVCEREKEREQLLGSHSNAVSSLTYYTYCLGVSPLNRLLGCGGPSRSSMLSRALLAFVHEAGLYLLLLFPLVCICVCVWGGGGGVGY